MLTVQFLHSDFVLNGKKPSPQVIKKFDSQKNHEVIEFRTKMRTFCEERAQERQMLPWQHWMKFNFPCDLEPCSVVAQSRKSRSVRKILVNVKFEGSEVSEVQFYMSSY